MRFGKWLALPAAALIAFAAHAQTYPAKPVRIIVPFAPGGATDIVTRLLAQKLTEAWGQQVVVDNRAGAGGNIGGELAAKAPPDGYTLFMTSGSIVTANQHMYKKLTWNPEKDLVAITNVASGPQIIAVHPSFPAKSIKELIALAKAKPGSLTFGSAGHRHADAPRGGELPLHRRHQRDAHSVQGRRPGAGGPRGGADHLRHAQPVGRDRLRAAGQAARARRHQQAARRRS